MGKIIKAFLLAFGIIIWISCGSSGDDESIPNEVSTSVDEQVEDTVGLLTTTQSWVANSVSYNPSGDENYSEIFKNDEAETVSEAWLYSSGDYKDWENKCPIDVQGKTTKKFQTDNPNFYIVKVGYKTTKNGISVIPITTYEYFPFNPAIKYSLTKYYLRATPLSDTGCWDEENIVGDYINYVYYSSGKVEVRKKVYKKEYNDTDFLVKEKSIIFYPPYFRILRIFEGRKIYVYPYMLRYFKALGRGESTYYETSKFFKSSENFRYYAHLLIPSFWKDIIITSKYGHIIWWDIAPIRISGLVGRGRYTAEGVKEGNYWKRITFDNYTSFNIRKIYRFKPLWEVKCRSLKFLTKIYPDNVALLKKIGVYNAINKCLIRKYLRYIPVYVKAGARISEKGEYNLISKTANSWKVTIKKRITGNEEIAKRILAYTQEDYDKEFARYGNRTEEWTLYGKSTGLITGTVKIKTGRSCRIYRVTNKGIAGGKLLIASVKPCGISILPKPICYLKRIELVRSPDDNTRISIYNIMACKGPFKNILVKITARSKLVGNATKVIRKCSKTPTIDSYGRIVSGNCKVIKRKTGYITRRGKFIEAK